MTKYLIACAVLAVSGMCAGAEKYEANWESLSQHEAAPEWMKDAKLGIYFHWGLYSVPAYQGEWYPHRMHQTNDWIHSYHKKHYGDPAVFGYHDFAPMLTGEHFDPEDWAELFQQAGARFAGPVAEHHDGYAMWASKVTPWNSMDTGPGRDILGDLFKSLRTRDMKTIATFHHARHLQGQGKFSHYPSGVEGWPTSSEDPAMKLMYGNMPAGEWVEKVWYGKLKEVIDQYRPDIIWFDSWLDRIPEDYRKRFSAYYLNEAEAWNREVVIIRKDNDMPLNMSMHDFEKSRSPYARPQLWMTDDTISDGKWCYTKNMKVKPTEMVLRALVDTVAKNGVVLLNVSPRADGVIPQDQRKVLHELGAWLKANGEAIYDTRPWVIAAEGPTVAPEGGLKHAKKFLELTYTPHDIRFTRNKANTVLYATALGWPEGGMLIRSLAGVDLQGIRSVTLLGDSRQLRWKSTDAGMRIELPDRPVTSMAYPVRMEFAQGIPVPEAGGNQAPPE